MTNICGKRKLRIKCHQIFYQKIDDEENKEKNKRILSKRIFFPRSDTHSTKILLHLWCLCCFLVTANILEAIANNKNKNK